MWPCGDTVFEKTIRYVGRHRSTAAKTAAINEALRDVLTTLQVKRTAVVNNRMNLAMLEEYLAMLYVLCNEIVEPAYDSFVYNGAAPIMRWHHGASDCVFQSTSFRFEIIMTAVAYVQLLASKCEIKAVATAAASSSSDQPQAILRRIRTMKACLCVCRDIISFNRRRTKAWLILSRDTTGLPGDDCARHPPELEASSIELLHDWCAASCQRLCIMYYYVATQNTGPDAPPPPYSSAIVVDDIVAANVHMHALHMSMLTKTRRAEEATLALSSLVMSCVEYAQTVVEQADDAAASVTEQALVEARFVVLYARAIVDGNLRRMGKTTPDTAAAATATATVTTAVATEQKRRRACDTLYETLSSMSSDAHTLRMTYSNWQAMADAETRDDLWQTMTYSKLIDVLSNRSSGGGDKPAAAAAPLVQIYDGVAPKSFDELLPMIETDIVRSWRATFSVLFARH